jgi:hypothetical protein
LIGSMGLAQTAAAALGSEAGGSSGKRRVSKRGRGATLLGATEGGQETLGGT